MKQFFRTIVAGLICVLLIPQPTVQAAQYPDSCPCDWLLHQYDGGIRAGIELLYFKSDLKKTGYATTHSVSNEVDRFKSQHIETDPGLGFVIDVGYLFPGTAYDATFRFFSLVVDGEDKTRGGTLIATHSNVLDIAEAPDLVVGDLVAAAKGRVRLDIRNIDVVFGQTVKKFNDRIRLRWLVGGRSAGVHVKSKALYFPVVGGDIGEKVSFDSEFSGFGPMVGGSGVVNFGHGLSLNAELAATFAMGKVGVRIEDTITNEGIVDAKGKPIKAFAVKSYDHDDKVVPMLDTRVSLAYNRTLNNDNAFVLETGLQVSNYFDADFRLDKSGADIGLYGLFLRAIYMM